MRWQVFEMMWGCFARWFGKGGMQWLPPGRLHFRRKNEMDNSRLNREYILNHRERQKGKRNIIVMSYLITGKSTVAGRAISFTACSRNASKSATLFLHWSVKKYRVSTFIDWYWVLDSSRKWWKVRFRDRSDCATNHKLSRQQNRRLDAQHRWNNEPQIIERSLSDEWTMREKNIDDLRCFDT